MAAGIALAAVMFQRSSGGRDRSSGSEEVAPEASAAAALGPAVRAALPAWDPRGGGGGAAAVALEAAAAAAVVAAGGGGGGGGGGRGAAAVVGGSQP